MGTELYYSIINIVDYLALKGDDLYEHETYRLERCLDWLLELYAKDENIREIDAFDAIADANDVGGIESLNWIEMKDAFKKLWKDGKRK